MSASSKSHDMLQRGRACAAQKGVALLLVLWIVAALALLTASVGHSVRQEAKMAQMQRHVLQGRALGEAAIYIALKQQLEVQRTLAGAEWQQEKVTLPSGHVVSVEMAPWNGLVNINSASAGVLEALLTQAASAPQSAARQLAQSIVDEREKRISSRMPEWESVEDLLQIPSMNYAWFLAIRPHAVANASSQRGFHAAAAPEPLRSWLRNAASTDMVSGAGATNLYRFWAVVETGGEGQVVVERDVLLRAPGTQYLPWAVISARQIWSPNTHSRNAL